MRSVVGKFFYGLLFCVLLPALLYVWASQVSFVINLPLPPVGWVFAVGGFILLVIGMLNLWKFGGGLPMNACPPPNYVNRGAYRFLAHPIYVGFCMVIAGISISAKSASGLYLITPVMILCCLALVVGYERPDLEARFGIATERQFELNLSGRIIAMLPAVLTWFTGYNLLLIIGHDQTYVNTVMPFEEKLAVVELGEIPYFLIYPFAAIVPFIVRSESDFKEYVDTLWWLVIGGLLIEFLFPFYSAPRPFIPQTWLGDIIAWERRVDGPAAAFPSFHVLWAVITAWILWRCFRSVIGWIIAALIAWSCVAIGVHSIADVVAGLLLLFLIRQRAFIIGKLRTFSERIANSWREWHIGPFRIINHSLYSGLAGFIGTVIIGQFSSDWFYAALIISGAWIGAILWGQFVEGSSKMLRPFGYFGALLGGSLTISGLYIFTGAPVIYWLAVFAIAAPFTQAIGRLRCLVQGCCHGKACSQHGILYTNPHTRVGQIPELSKGMIHNTQGYSIIANLFTGALLLRLYYGDASVGVIAGGYFILSGVSRFIEEAYRGEPQTIRIYGLRLYQWIAVFSIAIGCALTTSTEKTIIQFHANASWELLILASVAGLAWAFGMSMDFPKSTIRFSRLTG